MLTAVGLVKRYGEVSALNGFDLHVQAGEIAGLVGHNGAGKTTFIEVVTRLVRPDAGSLTVCGADMLRNPKAARQLIGVSPQEIALYRSATVRDNLDLFGALAGLRRAARNEAVERLAGELFLECVMDRPVGLISGGQQRRAQAATAMIGDPPLLLLDEPTAGADPDTRAALLQCVRDRAAAGATVVYTTHYLPELEHLQATLAVVRNGRVVARGNQVDLLAGLPSTIRLRFDQEHPVRLPAALAERAHAVDGEWRLLSADPPADLAAMVTAGCVPTRLDVERPSLDDLFSAIASGAHRDVVPGDPTSATGHVA